MWCDLSDYQEFVSLCENFGKFEYIDATDECDDEYYHKNEMIFKWKGQSYRFEYEYYSHNGLDFSNACMYEVELEEQVKTRYE